MSGGNPFGYLQAWLRIWTWDYLEQIHLAVRAQLLEAWLALTSV